jgi:hypothetical protein
MNPHLVPPLLEARVSDWIRHHIERALGLSNATLSELDDAAAMKRDAQFDELRMARLRMGHLRYGQCGWPADKPYDCVESSIARLREYQKTGNREHLIDVANLVEIEWCWPYHPNAHWEAQDCGGHWSLRNQETTKP